MFGVSNDRNQIATPAVRATYLPPVKLKPAILSTPVSLQQQAPARTLTPNAQNGLAQNTRMVQAAFGNAPTLRTTNSLSKRDNRFADTSYNEEEAASLSNPLALFGTGFNGDASGQENPFFRFKPVSYLA